MTDQEERDLDNWQRGIKVETLRTILFGLPNDAHVRINPVGNLSVTVGPDADVIGYISLFHGTYEDLQ